MSKIVTQLFLDPAQMILILSCLIGAGSLNRMNRPTSKQSRQSLGKNEHPESPAETAGHRVIWLIFTIALLPVIIHAGVLKVTGTSILNTRYLTSSLPAIALLLGLICKEIQYYTIQRLMITGIAFLGIGTALDPGREEGWRRAVNLLKSELSISTKSGSPNDSTLVLYAAGFNENAHIEMLYGKIVKGPAHAYGLGKIATPISHNINPATVNHLEGWIKNSRIESNPGKIFMVGLAPFSIAPTYIAERLDKNMLFVELNNVIVYMIY